MDGSSDAVIRSRPLSSLAASLDGSMLCVIMSLLPLMSSPYNERGNDRLYEPISAMRADDDDVGVRVRRRTGDGEVREFRRTFGRTGGTENCCWGAEDPKLLRRWTIGVAVGVVDADEFAVPG